MSNDKQPYAPVSCERHSEYELAIMHGKDMQLCWADADGNRHDEQVRPLDLVTRDHTEFLVVADVKGKHHEIRLDRITSSG